MRSPQELISLYLLGEPSAEEREQTRQWLEEDVQHVRLLVEEIYVHRCLCDFLRDEENGAARWETELDSVPGNRRSLSALDDTDVFTEFVEK